MMFELTPMELREILEALELSLEEFDGVEDATDYILTSGAREQCVATLIMLKAVQNEQKKPSQARTDS